ncbi:MAG: hypothetical protein HY069_02020 [Chlamydiia bacterium]|nr:hypothetical protein [Chlamydiia bacterium]
MPKKSSPKRTAPKKQSPKRAPALNLSAREDIEANQKAQWAAFRKLKKQVETTWQKMQRNASSRKFHELMEDQQNLLLLMGECNYMLQECMRLRDTRSQSHME